MNPTFYFFIAKLEMKVGKFIRRFNFWNYEAMMFQVRSLKVDFYFFAKELQDYESSECVCSTIYLCKCIEFWKLHNFLDLMDVLLHKILPLTFIFHVNKLESSFWNTLCIEIMLKLEHLSTWHGNINVCKDRIVQKST